MLQQNESDLHRLSLGIEGPKSFSVKRAAFAATIGNMLEFYDFITYSFFAIEIGHTFFPAHSEYGSLMLSLATFGAGFVTRPIGGIVLGIYSDRVGRRPAMLLSFALMGVAILAVSLIRATILGFSRAAAMASRLFHWP